VRRLGRFLRAQGTFDRIAIVVLVVGAIVLVASLAGGSEDGRGDDEAVRLVPSSALVYVHARVEPNSDQWRYAGEVVRKLPTLNQLRRRVLAGLARGGPPLDFDVSVRPWIGDEAALALLPEGRQANSLILLRVADQARARSFLRGAGRPREEQHGGVTVRSYGDLATAFVGDFLAIGRPSLVRAAIDTRGHRSLADESLFHDTVDRLQTEDPLAYGYAPQQGVSRLLRRQGGLVARVGGLLDRPGLRAAAASVHAERGGLRASVSSTLIPTSGKEVAGFEPTLVSQIPAGTIAYLGARGLDSIFDQLAQIGAAGSVERVLGRELGSVGRRSLLKALQPLLGHESALVVTPPASLPVISVIVANTSRKEGGEVVLALQPLLAQLLKTPSDAGQVPTLEPRRIGGVEAFTLRVSPSLELTYAAFADKLVVSTSPEGVRQLLGRGPSLEDNRSFAPGLRDFLQRPSSVVFLDLRRLTALAERAGLGDTPDYRAVQQDIERVGAVSAVTASQRSAQTAEIFLEVP
jgi:uncharacterized protein DUF3352